MNGTTPTIFVIVVTSGEGCERTREWRAAASGCTSRADPAALASRDAGAAADATEATPSALGSAAREPPAARGAERRGRRPVLLDGALVAFARVAPAAEVPGAAVAAAAAGEAAFAGVAVDGSAADGVAVDDVAEDGVAPFELLVEGAVSPAVEVVVEVPEVALEGSGLCACLAAPAVPREVCEEPDS